MAFVLAKPVPISSDVVMLVIVPLYHCIPGLWSDVADIKPLIKSGSYPISPLSKIYATFPPSKLSPIDSRAGVSVGVGVLVGVGVMVGVTVTVGVTVSVGVIVGVTLEVIV